MKTNNHLFDRKFLYCSLWACIMLCMTLNLTSQCPPGDLTFSTQSQIDSFAMDYPGCTTIERDLIISGADISNLNGLTQLEMVNQSFDIDNCPLLIDLSGLENLTYVGFHLWIKHNDNLLSLDGLRIDSLGWWLDIWDNPALENIHGLGTITSFGEGIFEDGAALNFRENHKVNDLQGLEGIVNITEHILITDNASLESLNGLQNVASLNSYLEISSNPMLTDISALSGVDASSIFNEDFPSIDELIIFDNANLSDCAIQSVCDFLDIVDPDYNANISNNTGDCIDEPAVESACDGSVCYPDLDVPVVTNVTTEDYSTGGGDWTRYNLPVDNWMEYPGNLFDPAPSLPPCGSNTNSSRTWVSIYNEMGGYIYGFCALSDPENLENIWFAIPQGDCPPDSVFVSFHDRECDIYYNSEWVQLDCEAECVHPDYVALIALYNNTDGANWIDNTGWIDGAAGLDCDPCSWYGVICDELDRVICLDLDGAFDCTSAGITGGNDLNGTLPAEISQLTELEILHLEGNRNLTGSLPAEFYDLTSLKIFMSTLTGFSGVITSDISKLINLEQFSTGFNSIGGPIPSEFGDLTTLTNLNLFYAGFSGEIPPSIGNLVNLNELRLNDNQLSGCFPQELSIFCPLNQAEFGNNPGLPGGGDFDAFCNTEEGGCSECFPDLVGPTVGQITTEDYTAGGSDWTRYFLPISNWTIYPQEMFDPAPQLPPCGANTNSSRSWVNIYDQFDNYIYGFCALNNPMNLEDIWFALPRDQCPPEFVFIEIYDRDCGNYYYSDLIEMTCLADCDKLEENNFDNGWREWIDGGSDCKRVRNAQYAFSGDRSVRLRDGSSSSVVTSPVIDASTKESIVVSFTYVTVSMDNQSEGFLLEYSLDGNYYMTVEDWYETIDFTNGVREFESIEMVGSFSKNTYFRFRCLGSNNKDYVYLDDIEIRGCGFTAGCVEEDYNEFDKGFGWGIWNDGGIDCRRSPKDRYYANSGDRCVQLRDDESSSVMTTDDISASLYVEAIISFTFITDGMDAGEGFVLEYSLDGGATFGVVSEWILYDDFENLKRRFESVLVPGFFTDKTQFRFRSAASSNKDRLYIDDVLIEFCGERVEQTRSGKLTQIRSKDHVLGFNIFPNPVRISEELTLKIDSQSEWVTINMYDILGNLIISQEVQKNIYHEVVLKEMTSAVGTYIVIVNDNKTSKTQKIFVTE